MNCLSYNCRGLSRSSTVGWVNSLIKSYKPSMIFLMETHQSVEFMEVFFRKIKGYVGWAVSSNGRSGGLAFLWLSEVQCSLVNSSSHHISMEVDLLGGNRCVITGFYGWSVWSLKYLSWKLLGVLRKHIIKPWVIIGDFNQILQNSEKRGGRIRSETLMNPFRDIINCCDLQDCNFFGEFGTYTNCQDGQRNSISRLDRAFCCSKFYKNYPDVTVEHLPWENSDHRPILLRFFGCFRPNSRVFRFENGWLIEEKCKAIVLEVWGNNNFDLYQKSRVCAQKLKAWKGWSISKIKWKIQSKKDALNRIIQGPASVAAASNRRRLLFEIELLFLKEETWWKQRSRLSWLKQGDCNSKFFHASASFNKKKNTIAGLLNNNNQMCYKWKEIEGIASAYFDRLFSSTNPGQDDCFVEAVRDILPHQSRVELDSPYSAMEVWEAVKALGSDKAPGPDGFNGKFFKHFWDFIGNQVTTTVLNVLSGHPLPPQLNDYFIALIPKIKGVVDIKNFRPIALCNFTYKIITKILATRIQSFLPLIISQNQAGFVKGRLISDNIILASEIHNFMEKSCARKKGFFALKSDLSKAYDRIEWNFIYKILSSMGFPQNWLIPVMNCISSLRYAVLFNGFHGPFKHQARGIRQGDPLSPFIFILIQESLSRFLNLADLRKEFQGVKMNSQCSSITHLAFADDMIFFGKATPHNAEFLASTLKKFLVSSGHVINVEKSEIMFSRKLDSSIKFPIKNHLGYPEVSSFVNYLGLPLKIGRNKNQIFNYIISGIQKRVNSWIFPMSQAARSIMVRSVLQSIPCYTTSLYLLPNSVIAKINSIISGFWWGNKNNQNSMHWLKWSKVCKDVDDGGMGFKDIISFNKAMLSKQLWRIISNPKSLVSNTLQSLYFPEVNINEAPVLKKASPIWKSLQSNIPLLNLGARKEIVNGESTFFWNSPWIPRIGAFKILSKRPNHLSTTQKVSEYINNDLNSWNKQLLSQVLNRSEFNIVSSISLSTGSEDNWIWHFEKNHVYSVKSSYQVYTENM